jgi:hypothetical protein
MSTSGSMVIKLRLNPPDWRLAKCRDAGADSDYDPFFEDMTEAVPFCNGEYDGVVCPIRHECLIFALGNNIREGVWGGCSEITRRAIRRRYPMVHFRVRSEWRFMTQAEAVKGIPLAVLLEDDEEDDDE